MKKYMVVALSMIAGAFAYGQTLEEAIKKTDNERFDVAAKEFRALIAKEPAKADNYFYYGENYLKMGEPDSASTMWEKSASVDASSPIGMVANGKLLWYKGDTAAARKAFESALSATKKKNAEVMRQIGATYTYAPVKNLDAAIKVLNDAVKLEPKNIEGYLILGDALLEKTPTNGTQAIAQYNKALDIDPKNPKGIVRKAKLYQRSQAYEEANELYKEAQALDPTYAPAYSANAELNMLFNQHTRAIENWKKYLELNNSDEARYRYATALFSGKRYCEAITELENIQANGFVNLYTRRMLAYSLYECEADESPETLKKGLAESDRFFAMVPKEKVISLDYKYRGLLQSKLGNDSLAILEFEKAIAKDSTKRGELSGEMAKMHMKAKRYDKVIEAYNIKRAGNDENLTATEFYELGRAYYFGPKDYAQADSAFKRINERAPDFAMAYLWRARSNFRLDTDNATWAAKPYYEEFLTRLSEEDKASPAYKAVQIEAAKYLGDYYVNSKEGKDYAVAKTYWQLVQTLEPADPQAKAFFASPAGR